MFPVSGITMYISRNYKLFLLYKNDFRGIRLNSTKTLFAFYTFLLSFNAFQTTHKTLIIMQLSSVVVENQTFISFISFHLEIENPLPRTLVEIVNLSLTGKQSLNLINFRIQDKHKYVYDLKTIAML